MTRVASRFDAARVRTRPPRSRESPAIRSSRFSKPAIGMRIGAHAPLARRGERRESRRRPPGLVEQLFGLDSFASIARAMRRCAGCSQVGDRHLVRAPEALDLHAVDLLRTGPALRAAQHDHGPARTRGARPSRAPLDGADLVERRVQRRGHQLVHRVGIVAFDELAARSHSRETDCCTSSSADAAEHGRIGDLVAVEMQDRQHRAVMRRIEELVGMPGSGERTGFGLAVADHAGDDQIRIVECRAIGMRPARSRVRRPRGSSRAFPVRHGSECRRETRTGETACACPRRRCRYSG